MWCGSHTRASPQHGCCNRDSSQHSHCTRACSQHGCHARMLSHHGQYTRVLSHHGLYARVSSHHGHYTRVFSQHGYQISVSGHLAGCTGCRKLQMQSLFMWDWSPVWWNHHWCLYGQLASPVLVFNALKSGNLRDSFNSVYSSSNGSWHFVCLGHTHFL